MNIVLSGLFGLFVRIFGALIVFILTILLTRELGAQEAGYYFLAFAFLTVLSVISKVGLDGTILKLTGIEHVNQSFGRIKSLFCRSLFFALCVSSCIAFLFFLSADWLATFFHDKKDLGDLFKVSVLYIPFSVVFSLIAMFLQGMRKAIASIIVLNISTSALIVMSLLFLDVVSAKQVLFYLVLASLFSCLLGLYFMRGVLTVSSTNAFSWATLFSSCLPLWWVTIMLLLTQWSGQLLLGYFRSVDEVALLAVVQRTSMLITLVLISVNMVVSPIFASLYNEKNISELTRVARLSVKFLIVFAMPILLAMIFFPEMFLIFFGNEFLSAAPALRVLAVGQMINVLTGPVDHLLSMSGHEKKLRNAAFMSGATCLVLGFLLIPFFGVLGAAYAIALAVIIQNFISLYFVEKYLGINMLSFIRLSKKTYNPS